MTTIDTCADLHKVHVVGSLPGLGARVCDLMAEADRTRPRGTDHPRAAPVIIGVFDMFELEKQVAAQTRARARGAYFLRIGVDVDAAVVGPLVHPDKPGCVACSETWTRTRWTPLIREHRPSIAESDLVWPDAFSEEVAQLAAQYLTDPHSALAGKSEEFVLTMNPHRGRRNPFLPHPNCPTCARLPLDSREPEEQRRLTPRPKPNPYVYRASDRAIDGGRLQELLVNEHSGLVKSLHEQSPPDLMPFMVALMSMTDDQVVDGVGRTGVGETSRSVALLEALERFNGFRPRARKTAVRASFRELGSAAVDPADFILPQPSQIDEPGNTLVPYSPDLQVNWVWAYSFARQGPVLIPEQLAYYSLIETPDQPLNRFIYEISNGCALGASWEEAVLHGLYEVIERDAFLTRWHGGITPKPIDISSIPLHLVRGLMAQADAAGIEVHAFDSGVGLRTPVVSAIAIDRTARTRLHCMMAAGAHHNPEEAARGALVEVLTSIGVQQVEDEAGALARSRRLLDSPNEIRSMADHIYAYASPLGVERLQHFLKFGDQAPAGIRERFPAWYRTLPNADLTDDLMEVQADVRRVASDVIVVDQSWDLIQSLGLTCVKVLAPGLMPVTFGHAHRRISLDRINKAIEMIGEGRPLTWDELNHAPHNFP